MDHSLHSMQNSYSHSLIHSASIFLARIIEQVNNNTIDDYCYIMVNYTFLLSIYHCFVMRKNKWFLIINKLKLTKFYNKNISNQIIKVKEQNNRKNDKKRGASQIGN